MLALAPLALFALALGASAAPIPQAAAPVVARAEFKPPKGWEANWLESYDVYHIRYMALDCRSQHRTSFFDECCHPLLSTESLSSRPAQCIPSSSASLAATSAAASVAFSAAPVASAAASAAVLAASDEDDLEYCDEEETASSTVAVAAAVQTTTSTKAAAPAATTPAVSNGNVNSGGKATYFYQGGNAGACGTVHSDDFPLAAITYKWWGGSSGQASSMCGKTLDVTRVGGKTVTVVVADLCPSCGGDNYLDLSEGAFTSIATKDEGMVDITWTVRD